MSNVTTLTVGVGKQYQTISAALAAANQITGGVDIQITAGTYVNDGGAINHSMLSIEGVGGIVRLIGANPAIGGAALFVSGYNVTLQNLDVSGVSNGAGIVVGWGYISLGNVKVHDNQEGVVFSRDPNGTLTILQSDIYHNGSATGGANVDVGAIASVEIEYSKIHDAVGGPEIRSQAAKTDLYGDLIADNASNATISLALPKGGQLLLAGSTIEKGPNSTSTGLIAWGTAGMVQPGSSVVLNSNVLINDVFPNNGPLFNQNVTSVSASYTNQTWNLPNVGSAASAGTTAFAALTTRPALPDDAHVFVESIPSITVITGNRDGGVTMAGRFVSGHPVTVADTVGGKTTIIGTATTGSNGRWFVTSDAKIDPTTLNSYTVSGVNDNGLTVSMPGALFLTDTGADHLTSEPGIASVFAVMSFKGADIIDTFKTTSAAGGIHDILDLSGRGITSFAQVQAMMSGSANTVLTIAFGKTVTLEGVSPTTLSATDFVYS